MRKNTSPIVIPEEFLSPLNVMGMEGRRLLLPPKNKQHADRQIIFFYGHHASHERMYFMASYLCNFGQVVSYDTPGFGGMDSFYTIGKQATLDNYADYLYTLFKSHTFGKKVTVVGISITSTMITRMLQRHPDMAENFSEVVSFVGFGDYQDLRMRDRYRRSWVAISWLLATPIGVFLARITVMNALGLRVLMRLFLRYNPKLKKVGRDIRKQAVQMELDLWRRNDLRTHFATYVLMLTLRMRGEKKISVPLYDISTKNDQYFDTSRVRKSLKSLYKKVIITTSELEVHVPSLIASEDEVAAIIPEQVKKELLS